MTTALEYFKLMGRVAELEKDNLALKERVDRLESIAFAKEQAVLDDRPRKTKAA